MFNDVIAIPNSKEQGHSERWHEERRSCIGGSDAGIVLGVSKFKTLYRLWEEKTGRCQPDPETEAMRRGNIREPQLIQEYADLAGRVIYQPGHLTHPEYPFIGANVDGLCRDRVLEIKTAGIYSVKYWGKDAPGTVDGVPQAYFYQVQHYMMVCDALGLLEKPLADIAVSLAGEPIDVYTVEGDPDLWKGMITYYRQFWEMVESDTPPDVTDESDAEARFPLAKPEGVDVTPSVMDMLLELSKIRQFQKELSERESAVKTELKKFMGECEQITDEKGFPLLTWKNTAGKKRFLTERFREEHPELYETYCVVGNPTRVFLPKYERIEQCQMK